MKWQKEDHLHLRLPTMHKPMKTKATEEAKIVDPPQPGPQPYTGSQQYYYIQIRYQMIAPPNPQDPPAPDPSVQYHTKYSHEILQHRCQTQCSHNTLQCMYLIQYYHQFLSSSDKTI